MTTPLVEMDGDEMTRVLWGLIKDELLTPYIDLNTMILGLNTEMKLMTRSQLILLRPLRSMVLL